MSARRSQKAAQFENLAAPLSDNEIDELGVLMAARNPNGPLESSISRLHGFLSSTISGPLIMPSEYQSVVFGDSEENPWEDIDQTRRAIILLTRFNNQVAGDLLDNDVHVLVDHSIEPPSNDIRGENWCRGYILGISLREDEWDPAFDDAQLTDYFTPIYGIADPKETGLDVFFEDKKNYESAMKVLPECAQMIFNWWSERFASDSNPNESVRRSTPKISPSASCPCGSGKKYKRCCSPSRDG